MKSRILYKSKEFTVLILKVLVICLAFYFMYSKIKSSNVLDHNDFYSILKTNFSFLTLFIILLFTVVNFGLEVIKWRILISHIQPISFIDSLKQTLSGMTFAAFTPNGIGEYGAKVLYYPKKQTSTILLLNALANGSQMAWTCFFGLISLGSFILVRNTTNLTHYLIYGFSGITLSLILLYNLRYKSIFGFTLSKTWQIICEINPQKHYQNMGLALMRFVVFCHQYYFIFILLEIQISYFDFLQTIFLMYFIASFIPSFQLFDVAIKGSVGVYLFHFFEIDSTLVITAVSIMWLYNYVIPSSIGSIFILQYRYQWK